MNAFKIAISLFRIYSTFVVFHQIVTNVKECCSFECWAESTNFGIAGNKPCKPIISYADWRDYFFLATILKTRFAKNCNLSGCHRSIRIRIWNRENFWLVQENYFYSANFPLVHAKCVQLVKLDRNVVGVYNSSRIKCQVSSLTFAVSIVIRRYNDNFLAKFGKTDW